MAFRRIVTSEAEGERDYRRTIAGARVAPEDSVRWLFLQETAVAEPGEMAYNTE